MLKCNGIIIYLLFTITVASQDFTKLKHDNGRRIDRINITLAEAEFEYDLNNLNELLNDDSNIIDSKYIRTKKLQTKGDKRNNKKFFDFVTDAIEILIKYSDSDLEQFFFIFNDEIKKYHYRGCKFYELTENVNFRMLVARNLLLIKDKPALLLRRYLTAIHNEIEEAKLNINKRVLLDLINGLYSQDAVINFGKILTNLDEYRMRDGNDMDLVKIIRSGIRAALFDYYTELDHDARAKIKVSIDEYLEYYMSIVKSLRIEVNNTTANKQKNKTKSKRYTIVAISNNDSDKDDDSSNSASSVDNIPLLNKKIRQTKLRTTVVRKPLKSNVETEEREKRIKHTKKQIEREGMQKYVTTKYSLNSSYDKHILVFDLPLSHNIRELTTRPHGHKMTQIFKYELHLNTDRKHFKEPKLYLKKPEFQVNFPAYPVKEMARNNRPNGQSLVDAPTFNHKNLINVRRMFDTGHIVNQANRGAAFLPIQTVKRYKEAKLKQGRRFLSQVVDNATFSNTKTNKKDKNATGETYTENNDQSQVPLAVDLNDKKPQRKEVRVDLKFNFDTIKRIITYPFDAIKNALSKKTNKPKKSTPKIKENKNKTNLKENNKKKVQINLNNIKNKTMEKPKYINVKKLKPEVKNNSNANDSRYNVNKTSTVITNMYLTDVRKQHNGFHNLTDTQYINAKKYILANKTNKTQVKYHSTKADIYNVSQKRVKTKTEKEKTQEKAEGYRAREVPPSIFLLENSRKRKNVPYVVQNQNEMIKKNEIKDATRSTTAYKFSITDSIDRFQYLRHLMNIYNSQNHFTM